MGSKEFLEKSKQIVVDYFNSEYNIPPTAINIIAFTLPPSRASFSAAQTDIQEGCLPRS